MQKSRRDFLRLSGSALVFLMGGEYFFGDAVGAETRRAFAHSSLKALLDGLPDFDGVVLIDPFQTDSYADDFGHYVSLRPLGVLQPRNTSDIQKLAGFCFKHQIPLTMRGTGGAAYGQTQVAQGFVIDSSTLKTARWASNSMVELDPGLIWKEVLDFTIQHQRIPPVMPDTIVTSVGGKASVGGIGETSYCWGSIADQVAELEIVLADGQVTRCSRTSQSDLFLAALGGMGQVGLITKVVMDTRAVPPQVYSRQFRYDGKQVKQYLQDLEIIMAAETEGAIGGHLVRNPAPDNATFSYVLDVTHWLNEEPSWLTQISAPQSGPTKTWSFFEYANRNTKGWYKAVENGSVLNPHPYLSFYLPASEAEKFALLLQEKPEANFGANRLMLSPLKRSAFLPNMFQLPLSESIIHFRIYRIVTTGRRSPEHEQMIRHNLDSLVPAILAAGGTVYLPFSPLLTKAQLDQQFSTAARADFTLAKQKYDPRGILTVNAGLF